MRAFTAVALLLTVIGCSRRAVVSSSGASTSTDSGVVRAWITTPDQSQRLAPQPDIRFSASDAGAGPTIVVDASREFQSIVGFGAAITDASAWLIQSRMSSVQREALLQELFGRSTGIGLSFTRLTIGASDFSRAHYTLDDVPGDARDDSLSHFSIAPNRADVVPVVQRARAINPALAIMATPWSAPAWMKSTRSLYKGTLRPDAYPAFAEYLRRYIEAYAAEGVPIGFLSVQNEPHHEPDDYPGMRFAPPQRADFIGHHLGPLFARRNVGTRILDWDHNWDEPQSPLEVLADSSARRYVAGVAWHCYGGDVDAQSKVHDAHPDKETYFTECAGGAWAPNWGDNLRWNVRTLIIGTTRNWARGVILWNLALDERHGPHAGGCNDCRGVVTINSASGEVTRNEEYFALAHASRFVRPGARRIASSASVDSVENVAFHNADDGTFVLVAVNLASAVRTLQVQLGGRAFRATLPAGAVATYTWR